MITVLLVNLAAVAFLQLCAWGVSVARRDASVADPVWGLCFVLLAWATAWGTGALGGAQAVVLAMVTIWGVRLTGYLAYRNWGKPEDRRYAEMREKHGARFPLVSLATVFGLQAVLAWIIALPVQVGIYSPGSLSFLVVLGTLLWAIGFGFEAVADYQLAAFKANPKNAGEVMDRGLWRYSRHPNYFGECLLWWGIYLAAAEPSSWWWTLVGPIVMTLLLLKVSGVTLLEGALSSRLDGYREYVRRTSVFVPWPPKQNPR